MKLLVLTSRFPFPLEKGDKLRLYHQLKVLAKYHEVILVSIAPEPVKPSHLEAIHEICERVYYFDLSKWKIARNLFRGVLTGLPAQVAFFYDKSIDRKIQELLQKEAPDYVYCQLIRTAEYLKDTKYKKTIDYMDSFSLGMSRRYQNSNALLKPLIKWEASKLANYEASIFDSFDHHTIISEQDKNLLKFEKAGQISVIPNGVDTDFFKTNGENKEQYDLVFVGNMGYYPNVEAVKFFAKKILPLLIKELPEIKVLIAGARPTAEVKKLESEHIKISGWVDDIRMAYADGKVFIAPIFQGSGQQNKILEAMAMGRPCVTSSIVNNAIGAEDGVAILLADDEKEFAQKILELLSNEGLRTKIARNARDFVCERYSWDFFGGQLMELIQR